MSKSFSDILFPYLHVKTASELMKPNSPSAGIEKLVQSEKNGAIWRLTLNMAAVMLVPDKEYVISYCIKS